MGKKDIIVRSIAVIAIIFIASIGISHIRKPKKPAYEGDMVSIINTNSNLPVEYMCKFDENDLNLKKYDRLNNYMSYDFEDKDILFSYYGYPNDESDFYLGKITLITNKYNLLGITVGDNMKKSISKLEEYGFKLEDSNNYFERSLTYDDITISIFAYTETYEESEDELTVDSIHIEVESEYLGNRMY